jgi:hypothetical protein
VVNCSIVELRKWVPLSLTSSLGQPNQVIIFSQKNLATVLASSIFVAKASAHLVTYSVATKI